MKNDKFIDVIYIYFLNSTWLEIVLTISSKLFTILDY